MTSIPGLNPYEGATFKRELSCSQFQWVLQGTDAAAFVAEVEPQTFDLVG